MNKQMSKRKILGLTLDIGLLISMLFVNDVTYLRFVGMLAVIWLMSDEIFNKL